MTSNVGSEMIMSMSKRGELGFAAGHQGNNGSNEKEIKEKVMEALKEHFKPEFLNRIDDIIMFHPLNEKQIRSIVDLQLAHVVERLEDKRIKLEVSAKAKDWLGKRGYDPNLGARPLKRVIQSEVLDKLALMIIQGTIQDGDKIKIDINEDTLIIEKKS